MSNSLFGANMGYDMDYTKSTMCGEAFHYAVRPKRSRSIEYQSAHTLDSIYQL